VYFLNLATLITNQDEATLSIETDLVRFDSIPAGWKADARLQPHRRQNTPIYSTSAW